MKLSLLEKSIYFKGLLLLLKKDNLISAEERAMMMSVCGTMGFDKTFCKQAIDTLLENEYILDEPPVFSSSEIAMVFISDGFKLACSDKDLDPKEVDYLRETAIKNGLDLDWFNEMESSFSEQLNGESVLEELNVAELL